MDINARNWTTRNDMLCSVVSHGIKSLEMDNITVKLGNRLVKYISAVA